MHLRMMREEAVPDAGELLTQLDRAVTHATGALDALRDLSRGIHPAVLTKGGLSPALHALIRRSPIPVQLHLDITERLPDHVEVSAYYVVAEALTNAAKHSHAATITVTVEQDAAHGSLRIVVADDGVGGADFAGGTGLLGLKDRVETLGGHIDLRSSPEAGTTVRVKVPLAQGNRGSSG
jgi:signal transduction histidine kinase